MWVLERYYCDFPIYNPALVRTPARKSRMNNPSFQIFDVDGGGGGGGGGKLCCFLLCDGLFSFSTFFVKRARGGFC